MSVTDRERATALLVNYFEALARKAGMRWDPDYTAEIGEAVDAIIAAARGRWAVAEAIARLEDRVEKLERQQGGIR